MTIYLILAAIFLIWFLTANILDNRGNSDYETSMGVSMGLFVILSLIFFIGNLSMSINQVSDIEELKIIDDKIELFEEKTIYLTDKLSLVLIETYAEHEKSIFLNLKPDEVSLLAIKYPELGSSTTFIELSSQIRNLNDNLYEKKLEKIDLYKNINFRLNNPVALKFMLKKYPTD